MGISPLHSDVKLLGCCLVLAVLAACGCRDESSASPTAEEQREPTVSDAQRLDVLVRDLASADEGRAEAARAELGEHGASIEGAVPALVAILIDKDRELAARRRAGMALAYISRQVRDEVDSALFNLPEEDDRGLRLRIGHREVDRTPRKYIKKPLVRAGLTLKGSVPALIETLGHEDESVRMWAADALGLMGPDAADAVPALVRSCRDSDPDVQTSAMGALGMIGMPSEEVISVLIGPLKPKEDVQVEPDLGTLLAAAWSLGRFGPAARPAVEPLIQALEDDDYDLRLYSLTALGAMGPAAAEAVPAIVSFCGQDDRGEMTGPHAIWALGKIGVGSDDVLDVLVGAIGDSPSYEADIAVVSIGKLGPRARKAVPRLIGLLRKDNALFHAPSALGELGPLAAEAAPELLRCMAEDEAYVPDVRNVCARAAARVVAPIVDDRGLHAILAIIEILPDRPHNLAEATLYGFHGKEDDVHAALVELGPGQKLLDLLATSDDPSQRTVAVTALGDLSLSVLAFPPHGVSRLITTLRTDADATVRQAAADALGKHGLYECAVFDSGERIVEALIAGLWDPSPAVATASASALGHIGAPARRAIPAIQVVMERRATDDTFTKAAAKATQRIREELTRLLKQEAAEDSQ